MTNRLTGVAGVLVEDDRVLLVKRLNNPKKGDWCIPCGKVHTGETLEQALTREFYEETHLNIQIIRQLHHSTRSYHPDVIYTGTWYLVERLGGTLQADDDAEEAEFFKFNDLPEMAFTEDYLVLENYLSSQLNDQVHS